MIEKNRKWHLIDAKDQVLGRMASKIATLLMGKNKPYYTPNFDCGDIVVVTNTDHIKLTGNKSEEKFYFSIENILFFLIRQFLIIVKRKRTI